MSSAAAIMHAGANALGLSATDWKLEHSNRNSLCASGGPCFRLWYDLAKDSIAACELLHAKGVCHAPERTVVTVAQYLRPSISVQVSPTLE